MTLPKVYLATFWQKEMVIMGNYDDVIFWKDGHGPDFIVPLQECYVGSY